MRDALLRLAASANLDCSLCDGLRGIYAFARAQIDTLTRMHAEPTALAPELAVAEGGGARRVAMVGRRLCIAGATLGVVGLFGWISGATWLTTMVPGRAPMVANTSLSLALIGGAGAIRWRESVGAGRRALSLAAAGVVLAVGLGTLAEYVLAVDLHIDQLLVVSETGPYPGAPRRRRRSRWPASAPPCFSSTVAAPPACVRPNGWRWRPGSSPVRPPWGSSSAPARPIGSYTPA
ncbi:hypothetical protein OV079_28440 [Nannocystis pusilla]|uniref:Transmembrane protein n=1 Tax=Nannocystis pusilla TaxID=889268 RepID=A0A9X3ESC1_9BACT|nr:hypothetical protein [Nannocystis pusilla]MCY1009422.1 hypothetical protein [Nannocystis pusilla]